MVSSFRTSNTLISDIVFDEFVLSFEFIGLSVYQVPCMLTKALLARISSYSNDIAINDATNWV